MKNEAPRLKPGHLLASDPAGAHPVLPNGVKSPSPAKAGFLRSVANKLPPEQNPEVFCQNNKISPDGFFVALLALATLFHFVLPIKKIISHPDNHIGIAIIVIGIALTLLVNYLLLKNGTGIKPHETPSLLVSSGPFKFSRNPLYLGMAVAFFGFNILLGSISPFVFLTLFIIVIDRLFIPMEENNLKKALGKKYDDYKKLVRRWI